MQDFQTALNAFGETMSASIAHHSQPQSSFFAAGARQVQWLFATFGGYATKALSKADVAVMFLSRKILVDQIGLAAITPSLPAYLQQHSNGLREWPGAYANGPLGAVHEPRSVRAVLGAMLFLAAVESGWQMHHRTVCLLPKNLQAAVSPMQVLTYVYLVLHIESCKALCHARRQNLLVLHTLLIMQCRCGESLVLYVLLIVSCKSCNPHVLRLLLVQPWTACVLTKFVSWLHTLL